MQLSFRHKAQLFHELAQLANSGIPTNKGFEIMARGYGAVARASARIGRELAETGSINRAFLASGFPPADSSVIEAGEATGRLEQVYRELTAYYDQLAEARKRVITRSIYPLAMLHLAAVLLAIAPAILGDGWSTFWWGMFSLLAKFYAVAFGLALIVWLARKAFVISSLAGQVIAAIPLFGGFLVSWSAWKFSMVFSMYVRSGGGMLNGLGIAGTCAESAVLEEASHRAVERVRAGVGLAEAMRASRLPETLERAIEVGEVSGKLDEEIQRASGIFRDRFFARLDAFSFWVPRILYFAILLLVGYSIIQNYLGVMGTVQGLIDGE